MKVLKFGGTSVANPENINKVKSILKSQKNHSMAVVVSAFGGVTDLLLNASKRASEQDVSYKNFVKEIEDRHIAAIEYSGLSDLHILSPGSLDRQFHHIFLVGEVVMIDVGYA